MNRPTEDRGRRAYLMKLEWKPFAILLLVAAGLVTATIGSLFVLGFAGFLVVIVLADSVGLFVLVWIGIYGVIEYTLWRTTRNPGHRLQYLGVALLLLPLSYTYIMLFLGGFSATLSVFGLIALAVGGISWIAGLGIVRIAAIHETPRHRFTPISATRAKNRVVTTRHAFS